MPKTFRNVLVSAVLLLGSAGPLRSQDSLRVVILSERVGPEIDAAKREKYLIFSNIEGFRRAIVFQRSDGKFLVRFDIVGRGGSSNQTVVEYSSKTLLMLAEKINHFEEIVAGEYVWGSDRATLKVGGERSIAWKDLPGEYPSAAPPLPATSDLLPFWANERPAESESFPQLSFRTGISTTPGDIGGIAELITDIENHYRQQGYSVARMQEDLNFDPSLWFSLALDFSHLLGVTVETAKTLGGDLDMKSVGVSLVCRPPIHALAHLRPFVGAGLISSTFSVAKEYTYSDRISPVDTTGGYMRLTRIGVQGSSRKSGGMLTMGLELRDLDLTSFALQIFAKYIFIPSISVSSTSGGARDIRLGGFLLGGNLILYF